MEKKIFLFKSCPLKNAPLVAAMQKKSVILDIITQHKQKSVIYSMLLSVIFGIMVTPDLKSFPATTLRLMFHVFQMMIPFSGTLLLEMITRRLMKKINSNLSENPMEMMNAFRVVDFCNAISGYYSEKSNFFSNAKCSFEKLAVVSDKTGTLTTSEMNVMGIWTSNINPGQKKPLECAELFAWLYTNQKKELEPEEAAMKGFFAKELGNEDFVTCDTLGNNHLRKKIVINDTSKQVETWHIGLYKQLGGRLTLVDDGEKKYLGFFGVPKAETFQNTPLLKAYSAMEPRTGVLTRDWCMAYEEISEELFLELKTRFYDDHKKWIEGFICDENKVLENFYHQCTFNINNPLKKDAEKFIERCRKLGIPVFVATGDTAKATKNVADILYPANAGKSIVINHENIQQWKNESIGTDKTIIFAGINDDILYLFKRILALPVKDQPVVIFSEMSTEDKGIFAAFLKSKKCFVAVIGDGKNDEAMMKEAHVVFAHLTEKGTYAPGVEQYANLNDKQLQKMFNSDKSFYELFDIHNSDSQFVKMFSELANSLEKPAVLQLKIAKMGFEGAKAFGFPVKEMWQQHWFSALFDLGVLSICFHEINESTDRPMDNKHLCASDLSMKLRLAAFAVAAFQASAAYALTGESTNIYWMMAMLASLPIVLKSLFSAFGQVQDEQLQQKEEKSSDREPFRFLTRRRPQSDSALSLPTAL